MSAVFVVSVLRCLPHSHFIRGYKGKPITRAALPVRFCLPDRFCLQDM